MLKLRVICLIINNDIEVNILVNSGPVRRSIFFKPKRRGDGARLLLKIIKSSEDL